MDHWDHLNATIKAIKARVRGAKMRLAGVQRQEEIKATEAAAGESLPPFAIIYDRE